MNAVLQRAPVPTVSAGTFAAGERHGLQRRCACGGSAGPTGECDECRRKREAGVVQRAAGVVQRAATGRAPPEAPPIVHAALRSSGQPLDAGTRAFLEPRFGHDFSRVRTHAPAPAAAGGLAIGPAGDGHEREADRIAGRVVNAPAAAPAGAAPDFSGVRVHADARAAASARALGARAYAVGGDLVFGAGEFQPSSQEGRRLLAHELVHTLQQGGAGPAAGPALIQRQAGHAPRKTIWINVGFDSSASANETTIQKLQVSIAAVRGDLALCCRDHDRACDVDVKAHYDYDRSNKPAPADGDYDSDDADDRALRDRNLDHIDGPAGGRKVLVTESTLSQTWQGRRIFPRANTGDKGILWNRASAANDTIAHESGHAAGYTGDAEGGSHSSDPHNLMASGRIRTDDAVPDATWCEKMAATAS